MGLAIDDFGTGPASLCSLRRLRPDRLKIDRALIHDVDRDADDVEHMLPKPLISELEQRLATAGRLPVVPETVPESPHELK